MFVARVVSNVLNKLISLVLRVGFGGLMEASGAPQTAVTLLAIAQLVLAWCSRTPIGHGGRRGRGEEEIRAGRGMGEGDERKTQGGSGKVGGLGGKRARARSRTGKSVTERKESNFQR